ncbi:hypothetical protein ACWFMI_24595 [Nocardiopsis terrae]
MYVHGRTLREVEKSAVSAIRLMAGDDEPVDVVVVPVAPQITAVNEAREAHEAAVAEVVRYLKAQRVTWADTAAIAGVTQRRARELLACVPEPVDTADAPQ